MSDKEWARRILERRSSGTGHATGEDPEIRRKMELMTGYVMEHGRGCSEGEARSIAQGCAIRADRRKR